MKFRETEIIGVWLIEPAVFKDERGYFLESFRKDEFERHVGAVDFIQENESRSSKGVLRGLHYQRGDASQAKLVRVVQGCVLDVAVDLRRHSPTFGRHVAYELSQENHLSLYVPRGFAHGFLVLSQSAVFTYKVDNTYQPSMEASILYSDADLGISWPHLDCPYLLSPKDLSGTPFREAAVFD